MPVAVIIRPSIWKLPNEAGEEVLLEELAYSERFDPYFRLDVKFGFQLNSKTKKLSQQF